MDEKRRTALALALALGGAATALGCETVIVDLGSNHLDAGLDASGGVRGGGGPVITATCPPLTDPQIGLIGGPACPATCADAFGEARAVSTAADLEAMVSGRWLTCSGTPPWGPDVVGVEFQAGCTLWLLCDAGDAGVIRCTDADAQGNYDVVETAGVSATRSLALHFFTTGTWTATATTSDCPHHLRLARDGASELDFAGIASPGSPGSPAM